MTIVKRLRLLTAVLGAAAATAAVGTTVFGDVRGKPEAVPAAPVASTVARAADDHARTRFSDQPTVAYQLTTGETVFAWQVNPALPAQASRPRDILVMVDTSASQAGGPMARARQIATAIAQAAGPEDRVDLWTININHDSATRSLTGGFQPVGAAPLLAAIAKLGDAEYGAGAVDLKAGIEKAAKQFERRADRQQVILYLGDGESAASQTPFTETARVDLGNRLAIDEISFFAVPLGIKVHPHNLHGLATLTGGSIIRLEEETKTGKAKADLASRMKAAFDAPVLRPETVKFEPAGVELYPTRLPPLRGDRSTLVLGSMKAPAAQVAATIEGRVNGKKVSIRLTEKLAGPAVENYFLNAMIGQYRDAAAKDSPAVLAADRALAMASEQYRMFRDEFTVQAVWAINADRLDHAEKLLQAAVNIDPTAVEANAGLKVLANIRAGKLGAEKVKMGLATGQNLSRLQNPAAPQPPVAGGGGGAKPPQPPGVPAPAERDLAQQARAAQQVLEQEYRVLVDDTIRRARRLLTTDPDLALADLKQQIASVQNVDQLSDPTRRRLVTDLESTLREVELKGAEIKRQLASQRERISQARQRLTEYDRNLTAEEQTKSRIDSFRELMREARFEQAQREAEVMIQERVSRGQSVPPETYASYRIGQAATQLRELRELQRIREDRYLLTMMQAEKSFIPYPDEPPVHFPPASVWRELTDGRRLKYGNNSLGAEAPPSFRRLKSLLEGEIGERVDIKNLAALSVEALLAQLTQQFKDFGVRFVYRNDLFPPDFKASEIKLKTTSDLSGLPLGSFLDTVLRDVEMSWIARPDYIEIGPNTAAYSLRYDEKFTGVFDVAELIVDIPQSVNPQTLQQNLQALGAQLAIFGQQGLGLPGGFQGGGFQGGGGGQFGGQPGGGAGQPAGGQGAGGNGIFNAGGGGGAAGVLGNLSGQFGIQGNDQSQFLVTLITSIVAPKEWDLSNIGGFQQALFDPNQLANNQPLVEARQLNTIGMYPPAKALVIRGSHRYHPTNSFKLKRGDGMVMQGGPGLKREGQFAANDPKGNNPAGGARPANEDPKKVAAALIAKSGKDSSKVWNDAFEKLITDPELIVDAIDAVFHAKEPGHAAEMLKAGLRKGHTTGGWAHEALAIALQAGQASPDEVERASLSGIDLEPNDAKAYIKAAKAESELGRHEIALAYCQRAATLEPNLPTAYANALIYADRSAEVRSDVVIWANGNLLARDWALDAGADFHAIAKERTERIAKKYQAAGKQADADKLTASLTGGKTRDLVIELRFQGQADIDLFVMEPTGSKASSVRKRTTGGGVLQADVLEQKDDDRSEIYTAAQAFSGSYRVDVKAILGKPIGNRATLKVTKFQGTDKESVEIHSIDLAANKPVMVQLLGGSRTEMASVPGEATESQLATTRSAGDYFGGNGFQGGFGAGSDRLPMANVDAKSVMPAVMPAQETRVAGAAGMPGIRVEAKLSADRSKVVMSANPVFTGPATDIAMPKINLLPGGGN